MNSTLQGRLIIGKCWIINLRQVGAQLPCNSFREERDEHPPQNHSEEAKSPGITFYLVKKKEKFSEIPNWNREKSLLLVCDGIL